MKKIYYLLTILIFAIGCEKVELETYSGDHYVQFVDSYNDSTSFTFIFYPYESSIEYPLEVKYLGMMEDKDINYKIRVVPEGTTASPNCYDIPENQVIQKGNVTDIAKVTFIKQPEMSTQAFRLELEILPTDDALTGAHEHIRKVFWITNKISQPEWWDSNFVTYFLGKYSDLKFAKFIEVTGSGDLADVAEDVRRAYCLKFKYYLIQQKEAGTPVLEADGAEMTVPILG